MHVYFCTSISNRQMLILHHSPQFSAFCFPHQDENPSIASHLYSLGIAKKEARCMLILSQSFHEKIISLLSAHKLEPCFHSYSMQFFECIEFTILCCQIFMMQLYRQRRKLKGIINKLNYTILILTLKAKIFSTLNAIYAAGLVFKSSVTYKEKIWWTTGPLKYH